MSKRWRRRRRSLLLSYSVITPPGPQLTVWFTSVSVVLISSSHLTEIFHLVWKKKFLLSRDLIWSITIGKPDLFHSASTQTKPEGPLFPFFTTLQPNREEPLWAIFSGFNTDEEAELGENYNEVNKRFACEGKFRKPGRRVSLLVNF